MANPPPVGSPVDGNGDRLSLPWMAWFSWFSGFIQNVTDYTATSIQAPVNGFSITIGDRTSATILKPAGVLATGTVVMPANPVDGMPVEVSSTYTVTSLTVSPNAGQTINNAPTTLTGGVGFKYFYNAIAATWYRLH